MPSMERARILFGILQWRQDSGESMASVFTFSGPRADFLRAIDKDFAFLGLNILPKIIAPRGHRGRKTLFQGFQKYYAHDGHKTGSRLVQARYEVNRKYNVSIEDIEHFELSVCYGLLVNTVPATAWVLYYIYSRPSLLEEVRLTLSSYIHDSSDSFDGLTHQVNITEIVAGYPLLSSLVQETLRVQSTNASGRVVLKDTLLEGQYLLKQGSILLIPSAELHSNASIWGPFVKDFDPRRFMQKRTHEAKVPASAYRAYGSGDSVCPGRYLAANEIMMVLVIMVLKYDLNPVRERWAMPETHSHITTSIMSPTKDIQVTMTERAKYKYGCWKFVWSGSGVSSEPSP